MSPQPALTRRAVLKTAALGAFTLPLLASIAHAADEKAKKGKAGKAGKAEEAVAPEPANPSSPDGRENGLRLGVTSYSTRNLTLDESIQVVKALDRKSTRLNSSH